MSKDISYYITMSPRHVVHATNLMVWQSSLIIMTEWEYTIYSGIYIAPEYTSHQSKNASWGEKKHIYVAPDYKSHLFTNELNNYITKTRTTFHLVCEYQYHNELAPSWPRTAKPSLQNCLSLVAYLGGWTGKINASKANNQVNINGKHDHQAFTIHWILHLPCRFWTTLPTLEEHKRPSSLPQNCCQTQQQHQLFWPF